MEPKSGIDVYTRPEYVHWYADTALTAVYAQIVELEQKTLDVAVEKSPNVFKEQTRARAHATCARIGYQVATGAIEAHKDKSSQARTEAVAEAVISVATTDKECRSELEEADRAQWRKTIYYEVVPALEASPEAERLAKIARPVRPSWAVAGEDLLRLRTKVKIPKTPCQG